MVITMISFIKEKWEEYNIPLIVSFVTMLCVLTFLVISSKAYYELRNNEIEAECFNFYKENNYVLEKCSVFEEKLKRGTNSD